MSELRIELQKHVLPIVVALPDGCIECIGTGFISFANGRQAHLVTAAHIIDQIRRIDRPRSRHDPSTPDVFRTIVYRFELKQANPKAIFFDGSTAHAATIEAAVEMSKTDIALCSIRLDESVPPNVCFTSRLVFDTTPIVKGESIIPIGYAPMKARCLSSTEFAFDANWNSNKGNVVEVYANGGPTGQKGPCFAVDVPFKAGMSGGPVFTWDDRVPYVRGFVMKGEERIVDNADVTPFSLAGMIWPLMLMPVDLPNRDGSLRSERCLLDLEREGSLIDKGNAHDHVRLTRGDDLQIASARWE